MNIKTVISNIIVAIVMTPVLIVAIILYAPYAMFRGLVDGYILNDYFNLWKGILNFLLYPVTYVKEWKALCDSMECKLQYYKDRCEELEKGLKKED